MVAPIQTGAVIASLYIYRLRVTQRLVFPDRVTVLGDVTSRELPVIETTGNGDYRPVGKIDFLLDASHNVLWSYTLYDQSIFSIIGGLIDGGDPAGPPKEMFPNGPVPLGSAFNPIVNTPPFNDLVLYTEGTQGDSVLQVIVQNPPRTPNPGDAVVPKGLGGAYTVASVTLTTQTKLVGFTSFPVFAVGLTEPLIETVPAGTGVGVRRAAGNSPGSVFDAGSRRGPLATLFINAKKVTVGIGYPTGLLGSLGFFPTINATVSPDVSDIARIDLFLDAGTNILWSYTLYGDTIVEILDVLIGTLPAPAPPAPAAPGQVPAPATPTSPITLARGQNPLLTAPQNDLLITSGLLPGATELSVIVMNTANLLAVGSALQLKYIDGTLASFTVTSVTVTGQTDQAGFSVAQVITVGLNTPLTGQVAYNTGVQVIAP